MFRSPSLLGTVFLAFAGIPSSFGESPQSIRSFLTTSCGDCHADGADEGGFELESLSDELAVPNTFAKWEQVYDRVSRGEMPPKDAAQPRPESKASFLASLSKSLNDAHAEVKATTLRRLNRREYQNTVNDLFGTQLDLESMLPEDARSHEFDNVGEALGLSMVHMERYMEAASAVLDAAIANSIEAPDVQTITAFYKDGREGEQWIGKRWKLLDDGAVVRFSGGGYPSGMLRGSQVRQSGRYKVRILAYAHQSEKPLAFSVEGTGFVRGSEKPIYGFFEAPPAQPITIEFETWIESKYMLAIEPYGISDPERYKRKSIEEYEGPGLAIGKVTLEGPLVNRFPSRGHSLIFDGMRRTEVPPKNPRDRLRRGYQPKFEIEASRAQIEAAIHRVAGAAFRRDVGTQECAPFVRLYDRAVSEGDSTEQALRTAVTGILCSPSFLFLEEPKGRLNGHALASRLAYAFTRTAPDKTLRQAAAHGKLTDSEQLRQQADRLMADDRFERFVIDFSDSWLDLREMDFTAPDAALFPEFDSFLRHSMPLETRAFLREMIESNQPIVNLVDSDFAMLNSRLAAHYDLPSVEGVQLRKVHLPKDSARGGLLTQASILKVTANGTNTSPVTRGAWVMERILGQPPSPPPPGIPGVEPDIRGATTLRELLDKHRSAENCRACHAKIDPPGFAMECYNPIGGFRERYRSLGAGEKVATKILGRNVRYRLGPEVDASGALPDGRVFENMREFRQHLARKPDVIAKTFLTKFLTFATGRELGFSDRPELNQIIRWAEKDDYRTKDLIHFAIQSQIFRNK